MPLTGCKHMTRILVAEFLLANASASRHASTSMLNEATAMLTAIVTDLALLVGTDVTVLLYSEATPITVTLPNIEIISGELSSETLQRLLRGDTNRLPYDAVLLIAPEADGVLVSLLKAVQEKSAAPLWSVNLDWRLAEIFADKRATDSWLRQHKIANITTKTINDATATMLQRATTSSDDRQGVSPLSASHSLGGLTPCRSPVYSPDITDQLAVLKPRYGAGSDGVQIVPLSHKTFLELPQQDRDGDHWLLQPFMPGTACSVGFIGGGPNGRTMILPPARQNIVTIDRKLTYHGGQIPCEPDVAACILPVAEQLAAAFGAFNGYIGADLLVDRSLSQDDKSSVVVVEINPRLCTSYIGYRAFAAGNLATWMLQLNAGMDIPWKSDIVRFSVV